MGARSTATEISKPLLNFPERFGLTLCLWLLIPLTLFSIASSVSLLLGSPYGARWFSSPMEGASLTRVGILVTSTFHFLDDHLGLIAFLYLAPIWLLIRHRPRLLAALMMAAALTVSCGLIPQLFHLWTIVQVFPTPPWKMQASWTMELGHFTYVGVLALILISLADQIDRQCRLREADRAIQRNRGPSQNRLLGAVYRRGHRHRALIRTLLGGGLHPWMALARTLPVAALPAMAVFCFGEYHDTIRLQGGSLAAPPLASFASPPPLVKVQLRLDASGEVTLNLPGSGSASWKAHLRSLRGLENRNGKAPRIEIDVAPEANLQVVVDALCALERAGFRDLVFADN